MPTRQLKTHAQVRAEFLRNGMSVAAWARDNGFGRSLVYEVLAGRKACRRGASHDIAVLLGLKRGVLRKQAARKKAQGDE